MNRISLIYILIDKYNMKENTRRRDVLFKRYYMFHELRNLGYSLSQIGEVFGKNHATILNGLRAHNDLVHFKNVDYIAETQILSEALEGSFIPKLFRPRNNYNIFEDILKAQSMVEFKRIKRRIKMGIYEEISPEDANNIQKSFKFDRDRAADTGEVDQELREGGVLCAQTISN